ncbi:MAG: sigma-54 dependent transcriptional regulator [Myxococcota bacterium]|jgi:two-component system nitrogen regulation response regulator GlnG|nr:sigma-54 dependent transcriptional regulator [Myxococcota bacterium]
MSSETSTPTPPKGGPRKARILVADDESSIRFVLREALEAEGHDVDEVEDGDRALEALSAGTYDIAFLDIRMPGQTGLELLDHLRATGSDTAAVVITAESTMENAVEAMKRGALDYLVKPFSLAEAAALAEKSLSTRKLQREVKRLRRETRVPVGERLIGRSAQLLEIFKTVGKIAARNVPVLITGESGTGKELVARAIHQASPRAEHAFVAVNSAAIPRELLESELFGHERGAFTGAVDARLGRFREADGGTLFLDEIGDMPSELQAKLLRVLQSGEVTSVGGSKADKVDVRILAATHRDLDEAVRDGSFREDLLYRLRVVPIAIPPLRERLEDIPILAEHFTHRYANDLVSEAHFLSEAAIDFLARYDWPGNVRELENSVKRALVMSNGDMLTPEDFDFLVAGANRKAEGAGFDTAIVSEIKSALGREDANELHREFLERVERPLIEAVLAHTAGNQIRAAAILGINRNTLRKKINDLDIDLPGRTAS